MESLRLTTQTTRGHTRVVPRGNEPQSSTEQSAQIPSTGVPQHGLCSPDQDNSQQEPPLVRRLLNAGHSCIVLSRWDKLCGIIAGKDEDLPIDGQSLDPAVVVAVAR